MNREADPAPEVLDVLRAMDSAFSGGDGDGFGGLFTDDGRLLLQRALLMNSHAQPIENVT